MTAQREPWSRYDDRGLARYITIEGNGGFDLKLDRQVESATPEGRLRIARAIYDEFLSRKIRYANERYHPSDILQPIRTTEEIFSEHEGTCLDLAALFCGACLSYELLPVIVVLDGHALAGVLLTHTLPDWNAIRPGRALFEDSPLTDETALRGLIEGKILALIECTGIALASQFDAHPDAACPETIGRANDVMSFDRALAAGTEQLASPRHLLFALDIAVAHFAWRIAPAPLTPITESFRRSQIGIREYIRVSEFDALIQDHTRNFVGRRSVFEQIDEHLRDRNFPNGYILLQGEPGSGKTAILSRLVQQRGYVHHFNIATQNIRSTKAFLENICAQLIVRFQLNYPRLPRGAGADSGPFLSLLGEALARNNGLPIVMLVDALDESEPAPGAQNRLDLPRALPDGAFLLVSTREQMDYQLEVNRRKDILLRNFATETREDLKEYISLFISRRFDAMTARIREWRIDADQFSASLADRSGGNFMYLVHVLDDIAEGLITRENVNSIDKLPGTLDEYYQRHWRTMRDQNRTRYEKYYEPVVCLLAAVREPVTLRYVAEVTQLDELRVRDVIRDWRQFLHSDPSPGGEAMYRIYHWSFQEFLAKEVGLTRFHRMITRTAVSKIPGLE